MPDEPSCVHCRRQPVVARYRPFCSARCQMADLGHWLSGDYRVPGPSVSERDTDAPEPPRDGDDGYGE